MNLYDKRWNEQVVRQVFSTDIADKILHTPLISQVYEDKIIWKVERNGRYVMRSAYRLCVSELVNSSHLVRVFGRGYEKLRYHRKSRIYSGVCVGDAYRPVSFCLIKVLFGQQFVLVVTRPMKTLITYFLTVLFLSMFGIGLVFGVLSNML